MEPNRDARSQNELSASTLRCAKCRYDLTGSVIGGACPECGEPIERTIAELGKPARPRGLATACFWCGIISITPATWFLIPVVITFYVLAIRDVRRGWAPRESLVHANIGLIFSLVGFTLFLAVLLS